MSDIGGDRPGVIRSRPGPLFPDVGVLGLVPDPWSRLWQPRHHVLSRLGRYFQVSWLEPPHEWRAIPQRLAGARESSAPDALLPGFRVRPCEWWLPRIHRPPGVGARLRAWRLRRAEQALRRRGCTRVVLYLWRPSFAYALDVVDADAVCYHVDDEYSFSDADPPLDPEELQLMKRVDRVFIHSPELLRKKGRVNPQTHFIPNGVDFVSHSEPSPEPADLEGVPRPWIGYSGYVKTQLDFGLLGSLIRAHPEWSFIFAGEVKPGRATDEAQRLAELSNVWFLGTKPVDELARYAQHFDVCLMPYVQDGYTRFIYPMKLHEYLAGGRPVVGTAIPSVVPFEDVVELARTPEEWEAALSRALGPEGDTPKRRQARQEVARAHDWEAVTATVAGHMARLVAPERTHLVDDTLDALAPEVAGTGFAR